MTTESETGHPVVGAPAPPAEFGGEFEAVIRGLRATSTESLEAAGTGSAIPLGRLLEALVRAVAHAQLAADTAGADGANVATRTGGAGAAGEEPIPPAAWVPPSFYQIAELGIDLNLHLLVVPEGCSDVAVQAAFVVPARAQRQEAAGVPAVLRILLRHVPPPPWVMANIPLGAVSPAIPVD